MPLLVEPALSEGSVRGDGQPRIECEDGLVLRPWREADAAMVQTAFGCPEIQRWHVRRLDSLDEAVEWTGQWAGRWEAETAASWAIAGEDDHALGQVGLRGISLAEGSAGISYWVTPSARGNDLAARATKAMCGWAFEEIGFHRLDIHHSIANVGSCRVAERTGFPLEGTLRQAIKHADGWHDWHLHGLIADDFKP